MKTKRAYANEASETPDAFPALAPVPPWIGRTGLIQTDLSHRIQLEIVGKNMNHPSQRLMAGQRRQQQRYRAIQLDWRRRRRRRRRIKKRKLGNVVV